MWKQRYDMIDDISKQDSNYQAMLIKMRQLEKGVDDVVSALTMEQQDLVWDFVMLCEEMSNYKLQLACINMVFPEREH